MKLSSLIFQEITFRVPKVKRPNSKKFLIFRETELSSSKRKKLLIFQEAEFSYILENGNPKKRRVFQKRKY